MTTPTITQAHIANPFGEAVLANYGDGTAMRMEVLEDIFIYFDMETDQLPEDVSYIVDNIIDVDNCR